MTEDRRHRAQRVVLAMLVAAVLATVAWWAIEEQGGWVPWGGDPPGEAGASAPRSRGGGDGVAHASDATDSPWVIRNHGAIVLEGVVLVDGQPTAGVTVRIEDATNDRNAARSRTTETDREGRFRFDGVVPIREYYRVLATGEELAPDWVYVPGDASKADIVLGLHACTFYAYGTIRDASGGPIESARVSLDAVPEVSTLTDAEGSYRLCVPERSAQLRVAAEGYGTSPLRITAEGSERHDWTLMPEGGIEGVVVLGEDGTLVPDATVSVWSSEGLLVTETVSDGAGHFAVPHLAPGPYTLRARAPRARFRQPTHVSVLPGETAEVVVPIDARVRVAGTVRDGNEPIADAQISIALNGTEQTSGISVTGADGAFVLEDVPVGTANVRVKDHEVVSPFALHVPRRGLDGVDVLVERRGTLSVTVLREGAPVHGARVRATSPAGIQNARTDALGVASLGGLSAGRYRVRAEHGGAFAIAEDVNVERGQRAAVSLELTEGVAIDGVVVDTEGRPVDGARVSLSAVHSSEDLSASAITDAAGAFRGGPLRGPATYRVSVSRSDVPLPVRGDAPEIRVPEEGPPSPSRITLVVDPQDNVLEGTVLDEDGVPVVDARVSLFPEARHTGAVGHAYTGGDGTFVLRDLAVGPFRVSAVAPSGSEAEVGSLSLPHAPITIRLPEGGVLHGTLEGFRGTPVVMAWTRSGYDWGTLLYAAVDGHRFSFEGLSPGPYYLAASSNHQATTVEVVVTAAAPTEVTLVASGTRTVHGRLVDLVTGRGLSGAQCQAAPYIEGSRSPVVVPGAVRSDGDGAFVLRDVPASDLYVWCLATENTRGGVGRIPRDLPRNEVTVYGLDVTGRPALDVGGLGFTLDDERPFSRTVATVEPGGPAARSGLAVGDVIMQVGPTGVTEVGNGTTRVYLALLLTEASSVPMLVRRGGAAVHLSFRLSP